VTRSPLANLAYEVGMGVFHRTLEQWAGDPRRAQFIMISLVKAPGSGRRLR